MFEQCDDGFIEELVQLLKPQVLLAGDCVFRAYEPGKTMYFIQNGAVQICDASCTRVYSTLIEGAYAACPASASACAASQACTLGVCFPPLPMYACALALVLVSLFAGTLVSSPC